MFIEDAERTHLWKHEELVELYESTNQPLVQTLGRAAQTAQAVVAAFQSDDGSSRVDIVLSLAQDQENVVYAGEPVVATFVPQSLEEALNFVESMGFILDNTGWPGLDSNARAELIGRLPAFRPPPAKKVVPVAERAKQNDPLANVARLFGAFAWLAAFALGCSGPSAEQRKAAAEIHYDLCTNLLNDGHAQQALAECMESLKNDDELPQTHNALGLLFAFSLNRPKEAEQHFKRALELNPGFSEASTNYGAFLLGLGRFAEAVPLFETALKNPLYAQRTIAETNLGWALYKIGQVDKAVTRIQGALTVAPKFCKGWRQLGTIHQERGKDADALDAYDRYAQSCPETADAQLQLGKMQARLHKAEAARGSFGKCIELGKDKDPNTSAECVKLLRELGTP